MNRYNYDSKLKFFLEQRQRFNQLQDQLQINEKQKTILTASVEETKATLLNNKYTNSQIIQLSLRQQPQLIGPELENCLIKNLKKLNEDFRNGYKIDPKSQNILINYIAYQPTILLESGIVNPETGNVYLLFAIVLKHLNNQLTQLEVDWRNKLTEQRQDTQQKDLTLIKNAGDGNDFVESTTNKYLFKVAEESESEIMRLILNHAKVEDNLVQTVINSDTIELIFSDIFNEFYSADIYQSVVHCEPKDVDSSKHKIEHKLAFQPFCQANHVKDVQRKILTFDTYWEIVKAVDCVRRTLAKAPEVRNFAIANNYSQDYHQMCVLATFQIQNSIGRAFVEIHLTTTEHMDYYQYGLQFYKVRHTIENMYYSLSPFSFQYVKNFGKSTRKIDHTPTINDHYIILKARDSYTNQAWSFRVFNTKGEAVSSHEHQSAWNLSEQDKVIVKEQDKSDRMVHKFLHDLQKGTQEACARNWFTDDVVYETKNMLVYQGTSRKVQQEADELDQELKDVTEEQVCQAQLYSSSEEQFTVCTREPKTAQRMRIKFLYHGQYNIPTIKIAGNRQVCILYQQNRTIQVYDIKKLSKTQPNKKAQMEIKSNSIVQQVRNYCIWYVNKHDVLQILDLTKNTSVENKDLEGIDIGFTFALSRSSRHLVIQNKNKEFVLQKILQGE